MAGAVVTLGGLKKGTVAVAGGVEGMERGGEGGSEERVDDEDDEVGAVVVVDENGSIPAASIPELLL